MKAFVESALAECFYRIFVVNLNTGEFEINKDNGLFDDDELKSIPNIYAYMQKLIDDNIIFPEHIASCRRFTNPEYVRKSVFSIIPSVKRIVQSYKARTVKGIQWVTFTIMIGENCTNENPMVLFTWREADSEAMMLLDTLPTISSLYDKLIRLNLSSNTYEPVIVDADEKERLVGGVINMYEWWAGYSKDGNIASEDISSFSALTKVGSLQKHFAEDPTPVSFRYRRKVDGEFRWVQLELSPSLEYSEDNQVILLSIRDVHEEYTAQLRNRQELVDTMNRDALTNLLNRLKFNNDIEKFKKADDPVLTCVYIDVNGLHELNYLLGHQKGDDMLCTVADTLSTYFPDEYVYRIGGDEFVVLSTKLAKYSMDIVIKMVREELLKDNYEIAVGVADGPCGEDVEKIIEEAELEMRNDKSDYYMRHGDSNRKRQMNEELEQMIVDKRNSEHILDIIAHQFSGVYFVDLASDSIRQIHIPDFFLECLEETSSRFSAAMRLYVERFVISQYREKLIDLLDFDKLNESLINSESIQYSYQKTNGDFMNLRIVEVNRRQNRRSETLWIFVEGK
ncbi:MAG: GGDEF domain-containing protein [Oscillospiraceae bacterium]|nr:GGDEF domain-containing protein [Oscillospiraceae bacterium]